jgi:glutamate synthase domain-containing protein 2/glutamate synthase domain-containing protein 1/glutamate synthase domain-containing protein 3
MGQDLYDPRFEHDACGVGLVCRIDGRAEHRVVADGLAILSRLAHRGATGCDPETGDGAGVLVQIPDAFFREVVAWELPAAGDYAVGMWFLPPGRNLRPAVVAACERAGLSVLGWRRVPVRSGSIGAAARASEPEVWQCFVARPADADRGLAFERRLFVARRLGERAARKAAGPEAGRVHSPSFSARVVVYKGMFTATQVGPYYPDLVDGRLASAVALVHSRFSTNTLPRWPLAHPFRYLCHNGEINTLRGNAGWMRAREPLFETDAFGPHLADVLPVLEPGMSDSAALDAALELLLLSGRSLPKAMMMLIPEAWELHESMSPERRAFYEYQACLMEPWDGPATVLFTDGAQAGAMLDRNGLRPSRYTVTHDGYLVLASESGTLDTPAANVREEGRLQPGRMLLVDLEQGRLVSDDEVKGRIVSERPYGEWLGRHMVHVDGLPDAPRAAEPAPAEPLATRQRLFGWTREALEMLVAPMLADGREAVGSMGRDVPVAVLSRQARPLFDYFHQLFAQVTNPPLDAIRERLVTSLFSNLGGCRNLFEERPEHADVVRLDHPVLDGAQLDRLKGARGAATLDATHEPSASGLVRALDRLEARAAEAVDAGARILVLSDRAAGRGRAPVPSLLALGAVHQHLVRSGRRLSCSLVVESGEPREVHHFAALLGFGASAVHPHLLFESVRSLAGTSAAPDVTPDDAERNTTRAICDGILKVMSKMGISAVHSYRGAQIFEAVGIGREVIERCFDGTTSRLGGIGFAEIAAEYAAFHADAYPGRAPADRPDLPSGGLYRWRRDGEFHTLRPEVVARLQQAVRGDDAGAYREYASLVNESGRDRGTLRGLLRIRSGASTPVPIDEVEPWTAIVRRFKTGAMSYGSISREAHETLAVAMNRIGGRSNTGEGGEEPWRYDRAHPARSRIKQVASGRFGVTAAYLASADEIQIKMAQGAKPGEGGQLPGSKVYPWIARTRHSTPWVGLISPPPHHDIYSIEDLEQLIHDLRTSNPAARISVKLVAEAGVGTVAAGVAKARADVVLISGHDGGTGASPETSIMHAGLPWELGLAETHQVLLRNGLRSRIRIECDGQLRTGRDVALAAMLGADEFGFATAPLIALGCVMMRKCHLNACPVGIATQDPRLRAHFAGAPEHVINYFHFVAEELRGIMASLGVRTLDELTGRTDLLEPAVPDDHPKARTLDLAPILARPEIPEHIAAHDRPTAHRDVHSVLDHRLVDEARQAIERGTPVTLAARVRNVDRTFGTLLSHAIASRRGLEGLPDGTITIDAAGTAGQSCLAFGSKGITLRLTGGANDYFGKGLSGAIIQVRPPHDAGFRPHEQIIVGNVALYGATSGRVFIRGRAGERFAVRNSGATAVVEGVGDHGCEYMTGGTVLVLGPTGRNFAAGMSGGTAFVLDGTHDFRSGRCDRSMVDVEPLAEPDDIALVESLVREHVHRTDSSVGTWVLDHWHEAVAQFVRVIPHEYRRALERMDAEGLAA